MPATLDIQSRATVLNGHAFGNTGAYEKIAGTIRFAVDPKHPLHQRITDIDLAPRNAQGLVEFAGDFYVLKPVDMKKGNGRLLMDVANRGRKVALGMFNSTPRVPDPSTPEDFGNGFLMREGYTVGWVGWQIDVPRRDGLMALDVPCAKGVTGWVRCRLRPNLAAEVLPLADRAHIPLVTSDMNDAEASITVREHGGDPAVKLLRNAWRFTDAGHVAVNGGFKPGAIYDVLFRSVDPLLGGLSFLAVRDAAALLRWGSAASGNPCAGAIERAYLFGVSQSGRFLRQMLHLGLDEDVQGRMVFDAVLPHVAGGRRGEFNLRFGQPSLNSQDTVGNLPPFRDEELFAKQIARGKTPKIFATNTSAEYWRGDASLIHTNAAGTRDAEPADFVRTYLFAGTQHTPGAMPPLPADANTGGRGAHMFNVTDYAPLLRAVLVNLDLWVSKGVAPPASRFPRLADRTAEEGESVTAFFKTLPGVSVPERIVRPAALDFGPEIERGIATVPPKVGEKFKVYVSAVDADGNETAGIRLPDTAIPVATVTGWNPRHPAQGAAGDLMQMMGSTLPFARTRAEREQRRDPRLSIAERYPSRAAYREAVRAAAQKLVAERYLLAEDVDPIVERGGKRWDWVHALG